MKRTFATTLVFAAALIGASCGGDMGGTAPAEVPHGDYQLENVDEIALPVRIFRGSGTDPLSGRYYNQLTVVVTGATITFLNEERFVIQFDLSRTLDGVTRTTQFYVTGTYEMDGEDIYFEGDDGIEGEFFGVLDDDLVIVLADLVGTGAANEYHFLK